MEKVSSENKEGERERQSIILTMKTQTMVKNFAASGRKKNFLSEEMEGGGAAGSSIIHGKCQKFQLLSENLTMHTSLLCEVPNLLCESNVISDNIVSR